MRIFIPTADVSHIFHSMENVPPTSPQYQSIQLLYRKENETCYEYVYRPDAFVLPLPTRMLVLHNVAVYDQEARKAYFHMSCPRESLFDLELTLQFVPPDPFQEQEGRTVCDITVDSFHIHKPFIPGFLRTRILRHILHQIQTDFQTI
jgi:hypothetical protein